MSAGEASAACSGAVLAIDDSATAPAASRIALAASAGDADDSPLALSPASVAPARTVVDTGAAPGMDEAVTGSAAVAAAEKLEACIG